MSSLCKIMACLVALSLPVFTFAEDVPVPEKSQKAKLEFVRSSGMMALLKARVDVNGKRVGEIGKGETTNVLIEAGQTLIKVDSAFSPGQFTFSFAAEHGAEYRFEIMDSTDQASAEQVFGAPPKVVNGEVLDNGGVLKAVLLSVNLPKPVEVAPLPPSKPASKPVRAEPVAEAEPAAKTSHTIEEQLRTLKHLYEQELISKEAYLEKQQKILDGLK